MTVVDTCRSDVSREGKMEREKGRQKKMKREMGDKGRQRSEFKGTDSRKELAEMLLCFSEVSGSLVPCTAIYCVPQLD